MKTVYDFTVKDRKGKDVSLKEYANEVLLIVNPLQPVWTAGSWNRRKHP